MPKRKSKFQTRYRIGDTVRTVHGYVCTIRAIFIDMRVKISNRGKRFIETTVQYSEDNGGEYLFYDEHVDDLLSEGEELSHAEHGTKAKLEMRVQKE